MRKKKLPPALKHAAYSAMTLLPGEDPAAFEKLHKNLISYFAPDGALEDDIVATIAHLLWRKQHLQPFWIAEHAAKRFAAIRGEKVATDYSLLDPVDVIHAAEVKAAEQAAKKQARKELGSTYEWIEIGEAVTIARMMQELDIADRLDAMIARRVKQLLHLRGLKSISVASSIAPPARIPPDNLLPAPGATT